MADRADNKAEEDSLTEALGEMVEHVEALRHVGESAFYGHISHRMPGNPHRVIPGLAYHVNAAEANRQQLFSRPPCQSSASALSSSKCKTSELVEAFRHFRMFRQEGTSAPHQQN